VTCRFATNADAEAVGSAHVHAWKVAYAGIMPDDFLASLAAGASAARWARRLRSPDPEMLVVETAGELAGFCHFGRSRDDDAAPEVGEVIAINLHPDHWRKGLGRQLLARTEEELQNLGLTQATLWVLAKNARARAFYEALGWRPDGAEKNDAPAGCPPLPHLRYRVSLARPRLAQ
jgi:GNAT superfamily N-acetyltransferase